MAFHATIAEIAGNAMIASVTRAILDWLSRFRVEVPCPPAAPSSSPSRSTRRSLPAIGAGRVEEAAAALSAHLTRANALYSALAARDAAVSVAS